LKIRRRFASGGVVSRLLDYLRQRWFPARETGATQATGATEATGATAEPVSPPHPALRWLAALPIPPSFRDRRFALVAGGVLLGTVVVGYLLAALVFFPAPIFASSRSVPRLIGLQEAAAGERLQAEQLRIGAVTRTAHPTAPSGTVVWQEPPPGVVAREATEVTLTVSDGARRIPVPDVAGYEAEQARLLIEAAGLRVGSIESAQAPTPKNVVVNTRPSAGAALVPGASLTLVVSLGAATIRVPTLRGLTVDEARLALETAGLALGTWFGQITTEVAPGEVFYQEPAAGTLSAPGSAVNVRVARSGQ
jgi:serine/threonine-protein kinase